LWSIVVYGLPGGIDLRRLWDDNTGVFKTATNQPSVRAGAATARVTRSGRSGRPGHSLLDAGLLAHGGFTPDQVFLFETVSRTWQLAAPTMDGRFYPTTLTLPDGKILTMFGTPASGGTPRRSRSTIPLRIPWAPRDYHPGPF
jgi:hypothetical protein